MLSWNQVVEVSFADARTYILEKMEAFGFSATSWQEGSIPLAFVEVGADFWNRGTKVAAFLKTLGYNDTSEGEALTRFSRSHYANERQGSTAAQRLVTLTCEADEGPHTINVGEVIASGPDFQYRNVIDDDGEFPENYPAILSSGGTLQIILEAETAGTTGNAEAGSVTTLVTTLAGVTITEDIVHRVGTDEESDPRLQQRNPRKWSLLTRFGVMDDALEALALEVEAVDRVGINSQNPRGAGTIDVWITGEEGDVGDEDLEDVFNAIAPYLMGDAEEVLQVDHAPLVPLNIAGTVYVVAGYDWTNVVKPAVLEALEAWRRTIPLGGFPYPLPGNRVPLNEIEHVIRNVKIGESYPIKTVKLTTPAADVAVTAFGHVTQGSWTSLTPVFVS